MDPLELSLLALAIGVVAFLYSSVGHAGASGYIAVMTLFGLASTTVRPISLVLNILVAVIGTFQFWRAGYFSWKLFWPFAICSIPMAFLGGYLGSQMAISPTLIKQLIGVVLLYSAARLFFRQGDPPEVTPPNRATSFGVGAAIGLLSGLTGTGGGIFLTPLLLFRRWAQIRPAAALSVVFILVNSIAGLAGHFASGKSIPNFAWGIAATAIVGGTLGSYLGSKRFPPRAIQTLLATVLVVAGIKLLTGK